MDDLIELLILKFKIWLAGGSGLDADLLYAKEEKMSFEKIKETLEHIKGCQYENRSIPIDECMCDCNEKHFYQAGLEAGKNEIMEKFGKLGNEFDRMHNDGLASRYVAERIFEILE